MGMQNFQDTIHTFKRSSMNRFPICITVPLSYRKSKGGYIIGVSFLRMETPGKKFPNKRKYL